MHVEQPELAEPLEKRNKRSHRIGNSRKRRNKTRAHIAKVVKNIEHGRDIESDAHGRIESRGFRHVVHIRMPGKGANENDRELDADCEHDEQDMPEPKSTSRSEEQRKTRRRTRRIRDAVMAGEKVQQQVRTYVQRGEYYSNITEEKLDKDKVGGARKEDMKYFERVGVCTKRHSCKLLEGLGECPLESSGSTSRHQTANITAN